MPLLWLSLAFIIGLVAAGWSRVPWPAWLTMAGIAFLLTVFPWWKRPWPALRHPGLKFAPLLLLVFLALGGLRYELAHQPPTPRDLAYFNGRGPAEISAWVADPPDQRDTLTLLRLRVEQVASPPESALTRVRGQVLVVLPAGADWRYGDRLLLSGNPVTPPEYGDFSYRDYLARQGIYTYLAYPRVQQIEGRAGSPILAGIYFLRDSAHRVLTALFSPPEGPLLDGILLGLDRGLPADIEDAFRRTGTSHIIAISGFNMTILAGLFAALFGRLFSRWGAALAALLAIAAYTLLVGAGPAVVRAALMSGLALVAVQIGRSAGGLNALMLAAGGMCLLNPDLPWDVSFQLSFAATLGLLLYASRLEGALRGFAERRLPARWAGTLSGLVAENVLFTLVAQAFTLPIILYHFGRISLVASLANALVLPVQAGLMILSGLAVLLGLLWLPLGQLLAAPAWALAAYTLRVVGWLGGSPGAEWVVGPGGWMVPLLAYAALLLAAFAGGWIKAHMPRLRPAVGLLLLGGLAIFLWRQALAGPDGNLYVVAYNFEGQVAVLVRAPEGQSLLIAGGARASQLSAGLGRWLPPLGRKLDGVLVNDARAITLQALPDTLARFPPSGAYWGVDMPGNAA
nr:ComEC/Rec2 family competence protein [Anaerolinea sp.]